MSTGEDARDPHPVELKETVRESTAESARVRGVHPNVGRDQSRRPTGLGGVANYREFAAALIDIGILDFTELKRFAADSSEGVLGLSRVWSRPAS